MTNGDTMRALYEALTNKGMKIEWAEFTAAIGPVIDNAAKAIRSEMRSEAHAAVYKYKPINPDGMVPLYRVAYEETQERCAAAVLSLPDKRPV